MHYFNRILYRNDKGHLHCSFDPIIAPGKLKYKVSVLTKGPQQANFEMEERWGRWKIVTAPLPPQWAFELEESLNKIILQQNFPTVIDDYRPLISMEQLFPEPRKTG